MALDRLAYVGRRFLKAAKESDLHLPYEERCTPSRGKPSRQSLQLRYEPEWPGEEAERRVHTGVAHSVYRGCLFDKECLLIEHD